ncbi:Rpn family recombination-promoting nuclease/putative transposase [Spirosoma litoris]
MELSNSEEQRFIPLISDYGFKVTFGNEANTLFLRKALQALIKSPRPITSIEFDKNTIEGYTADSRGGVYDMSCKDDVGNHFIVEMQLGDYPQFLQRMKFYATYKLNTLVKKGNYSFDKLATIYCVGILKHTIFPDLKDYHNISTLRNERGEQTDNQLSFVTVELDKFNKRPAIIKSDLDKLVYTMKTLHKVKHKRQFPEFWDEEWLKKAIQEVDRSAMTAEERFAYEKRIAQNAAIIYEEKKKIESIKKQAITKGLQKGLSPDLIAEVNDVPLAVVLEIQSTLTGES